VQNFLGHADPRTTRRYDWSMPPGACSEAAPAK
jgi:hypothetical protein